MDPWMKEEIKKYEEGKTCLVNRYSKKQVVF